MVQNSGSWEVWSRYVLKELEALSLHNETLNKETNEHRKKMHSELALVISRLGTLEMDTAVVKNQVEQLNSNLKNSKQDIRDNTAKIAEIIKDFGPWIGLIILVAKDLIL